MLEHSGQHMRQSGNESLSVCGLSNLADYRQGAGGRLAVTERGGREPEQRGSCDTTHAAFLVKSSQTLTVPSSHIDGILLF